MEEKKVKMTKIIRKDIIPDPEGNIRIGEPVVQHESFYDAVGNLVEERSYDREGILVEHYHHTYDEHGRHMMKSSMDEEGNRIEVREIAWMGDKPGEERIEYMDGSVNLVRYSYSEQGELTGKEIIDPEDGFEGKEVFIWENGHLVSEEHYNWEKEKTFYRHMQVDEAGRMLRQEEVNGEGELIAWVERSYPETGDLCEATIFRSGMGMRPDQHYRLEYEYQYQ
ncbi:MAG: hypothetical protein FJY10_08745 [Bacteroidetes bacterium]|nr:hypothetical protein [Bacteroidota bacterium]